MVDFPYPDTNMTNFSLESVRTALIPFEKVLGEFVMPIILLVIGIGLYQKYKFDKVVLAIYFAVLFTIFGPILNVWFASFLMIIFALIVTLLIIKRFMERN